MAIAELYTGTEAIGATEWSCTTDTAGPDADTTDGVFQVFLDTADMVAGDQLRIKIYEKITSGGTQREIYTAVLTGTMTTSPDRARTRCRRSTVGDSRAKAANGAARAFRIFSLILAPS